MNFFKRLPFFYVFSFFFSFFFCKDTYSSNHRQIFFVTFLLKRLLVEQ